MIVRHKPGFLELLIATHGSVLPRILPRIAVLTALAALLVWVDVDMIALPHTNAAPFAVFGVALSLFLGFRNNAAYDRWWEGRKLWGQLVADMRALGRDVALFLPAEHQGRPLRLALAFIHLHRAHLRRLSQDEAGHAWLDDGDDLRAVPHPPCAALDLMTRHMVTHAPDGFAKKALSERIAALTLAQAGCERIAATPLPFVYSLLVFRTTYLYCLLFPFSLIEGAGWMTPLFVAIVAYVFFGLAEVTEELSNPFGKTVNGLPLDAMCRTIEISLLTQMGEDAPAPLQPDGYYLS